MPCKLRAAITTFPEQTCQLERVGTFLGGLKIGDALWLPAYGQFALFTYLWASIRRVLPAFRRLDTAMPSDAMHTDHVSCTVGSTCERERTVSLRPVHSYRNLLSQFHTRQDLQFRQTSTAGFQEKGSAILRSTPKERSASEQLPIG